MHTQTMDSAQGWFTKATAWLDERGKLAWIAAMVLGFIFVWPLGLAILFYMIWSKRMFGHHNCKGDHHRRHRSFGFGAGTGNSAFDGYRKETIKRLMDEQEEFIGFLNRLRSAKDQTEFDMFMDQRHKDVTKDDGASDAQPA